MRDAAGQLADRLEFQGLAQLLFGRLAVIDLGAEALIRARELARAVAYLRF